MESSGIKKGMVATGWLAGETVDSGERGENAARRQ